MFLAFILLLFPGPLVLNLYWASESPGRPHSPSFWFGDLGQGPGICISHRSQVMLVWGPPLRTTGLDFQTPPVYSWVFLFQSSESETYRNLTFLFRGSLYGDFLIHTRYPTGLHIVLNNFVHANKKSNVRNIIHRRIYLTRTELCPCRRPLK